MFATGDKSRTKFKVSFSYSAALRAFALVAISSGIAVGRRASDRLCCDIACGAPTVLNNECLAETLRQCLAD